MQWYSLLFTQRQTGLTIATKQALSIDHRDVWPSIEELVRVFLRPIHPSMFVLGLKNWGGFSNLNVEYFQPPAPSYRELRSRPAAINRSWDRRRCSWRQRQRSSRRKWRMFSWSASTSGTTMTKTRKKNGNTIDLRLAAPKLAVRLSLSTTDAVVHMP